MALTAVATFLFCAVFLFPSALSEVSTKPVKQEKQEPTDVQKADKAVYDFIVASVEADHDLRKTVVTAKDHDILESGRHLYPGTAKKMGERYTIKRFDHLLKSGKLYYYIEYYSPENKTDYAMNLLMIKEKDGKWRSSSLTGIPGEEMRVSISDYEEKGVLVHQYKERNR